MKYLRLKEIIIAMPLMFLIACGGGGNNGGGGNDNNVSISVSNRNVTAPFGKTTTISVSTTNTDIELTSTTNGAGCVRSSRTAVACSPTAAGAFTVTITASDDRSKSVNVTVNVPEMVIESSELKTGSDGNPELLLSADDTKSNPIKLFAAAPWTAKVDSDGGETPAWIRLRDASDDISITSITVFQSDVEVNSENAGSLIGSAKTGAVAIEVELDPNYSGEDRSAVIVIEAGNSTLKITVIQKHTIEDGTNLGDGMML